MLLHTVLKTNLFKTLKGDLENKKFIYHIFSISKFIAFSTFSLKKQIFFMIAEYMAITGLTIKCYKTNYMKKQI